jgi:hypothetical protein
LQHLDHLSDTHQSLVLHLINRTTNHDGTPPIAEHILLHLRYGGDKADSHLLVEKNNQAKEVQEQYTRFLSFSKRKSDEKKSKIAMHAKHLEIRKKFGKRIDVKLMTLFVYSPYVSYYNDLVLKSPYVILPSLGTNIAITKRFKFNINAGGAWAIKVNTLNYTITCGTRLLVGQ